MGRLFFWMTSSPDANIVNQTWTDYLDYLGFIAVIALAASTLLTLLAYSTGARAIKITRPADYFEPHGPTKSLLVSLLAGAIVLGVGFMTYESRVGSVVGMASSIGLAAIWITVLTAVLSWLLILVLPGMNPANCKYRATELFMSKKQ